MIIVQKLYQSGVKNGYLTVWTNWGNNNSQTSYLAFPYGIVSLPDNQQTSIILETQNNSDDIAIGFITKELFDDLAFGETIIYSQNGEGEVISTIKLKNDGNIEMNGNDDFMVRYSKLEEAYNELNDKFNDLVIAFNNHVHPANGSPPTPSPTVPAQQSEGDITPSKIENVKTNSGE